MQIQAILLVFFVTVANSKAMGNIGHSTTTAPGVKTSDAVTETTNEFECPPKYEHFCLNGGTCFWLPQEGILGCRCIGFYQGHRCQDYVIIVEKRKSDEAAETIHSPPEKRGLEDNVRPPPYRTDEKMTFYQATSSSVWDDRKDLYGPENLFDGAMRSNSYDVGACFSTLKKQESWAQLDSYDYMAITEIKFNKFVDKSVNGDDSVNYEDIEGLKVKVCQNSSRKDCKLFGTVERPLEGGWIEVKSKKDMDLKGATILLEHDTAIQICEIIVKGGKVPETEMTFYKARGSEVWNGDIKKYGPQNLIDGDLRTDTRYGGCFHSENVNTEYFNSFVQLYSKEELYITEIYILNRWYSRTHVYKRTNGLRVNVCSDYSGKNCSEFGSIENAPNGGWIRLSRNSKLGMGPSSGVLLFSYIALISICEVRVIGTKLPKRRMTFYKAQSSGNWNSDIKKYGPQNLYDGDMRNNAVSGGCFIGEERLNPNTNEAWVALDSKDAHFITNIYILNSYSDSQSIYKRIKGLRVEVCPNSTKTDCTEFGTVKDAPNGGWIKLPRKTDMKLEGEMTVLLKHNKPISVCELIADAKKVPQCDECTQELVKRGEEFVCRERIELSTFVSAGRCECECGEGEQLETRTCSLFQNVDGICAEKTFDSVPEDPTHACAQFQLNRTVRCDDKCKRIELSAFVAAGRCECECGEGEQLEIRTCSSFENVEGICAEKTFDSVPEDPTHACAQFQLNRTVRCDDKCNRNTGWVDEYADVGDCQYGPDYLCGSCLEGFQRQLKKCNALVKNGSECNTVETGDPSLCGLDQPQRTIPCEISNHENAITCKVDRLIVYTWDAEGSGTNDNLYFFAYDGFKPIMVHESRFLFSGENYCYLGSSNLPNHKATQRGTTTVYTNLTVYRNRLCLYQKSFTKMTVKIDGNDDWRGNISAEVNGVLHGYSNGFQSLSSSSFLTYWRVEQI